jgi:hypothetical protein
MFKVESSSSGSSANNPNLSLNQQNNFDFELSFCDDGATDDLFDSFNPSSASSPTNTQGRGSGGGGKAEDSPLSDPLRVKVEPEDSPSPMMSCGALEGVRIKVEPVEDVLMPVVSDLEAAQSPASTTTLLDSVPMSPLPEIPGGNSNPMNRKGKPPLPPSRA